MNDLLRALAPIPDTAWRLIEEEARRTLRDILAARKLVDFTGPLGWEAASVNTGRVRRLAEPAAGVEARVRGVQPLVELRVPFELERGEVEAAGRGAKDADLNPVRQAARTAAGQEATLRLTDDYTAYPSVVADAVGRLRTTGVHGPYAIALGPRCYSGLTKTTVAGYPVMEHVRRLLDGPIIWAPGVDGAVVLSQRGGDFELTVGQDFSIGYLEHSASSVRLYLQESFTFRVLAPEAAVPLSYAKQ
jgi:uncharacterized linocin/CFP29 family protein